MGCGLRWAITSVAGTAGSHNRRKDTADPESRDLLRRGAPERPRGAERLVLQDIRGAQGRVLITLPLPSRVDGPEIGVHEIGVSWSIQARRCGWTRPAQSTGSPTRSSSGAGSGGGPGGYPYPSFPRKRESRSCPFILDFRLRGNDGCGTRRYLRKVSPNRRTTAASTSSISTTRPSSASIEPTSWSVIPHGTIAPKNPRSVVTLSANP